MNHPVGRGFRLLFLLALALPGSACGPDLGDVPNIESARGTKIVCLGDSLTYGYRVARGQSYPALLATKLGVDVINSGKNGNTIGAALQRFDRDVAVHEPAIVVVCLGGNDGLLGGARSKAQQDLLQVVERIIAIGAVPVVIGLDLGPLGPGYTDFIEQVADQTGALYIDEVLDDILRSPGLKVDQVHPNAAGYERLADRLAVQLKRLLDAIRAHQE